MNKCINQHISCSTAGQLSKLTQILEDFVMVIKFYYYWFDCSE